MNNDLTKEQWQAVAEKLVEYLSMACSAYHTIEDCFKCPIPCEKLSQSRMASKLADTLRVKANELMQESQNEWSGEYLHTLIGNFAGYIIGVADGIDFYLSLQKQKEEKE